MVCGRGNTNNTMLGAFRQIIARLDAMETTQRREARLEYVSDGKAIAPKPNLEPK